MTPALLPLMLALVVAAAAAGWAVHRLLRSQGAGPEAPVLSSRQREAVEVTGARAGSRSALALVVAVLVLGGAVGLATAAPELLGLPLALGPGMAAAAGLLAFAAVPSPRPVDLGPASASLRPRRPWSFGRWPSFATPLGLALAFAAFLVWAGLAAGPDEQGRGRSYAVTSADGMAGAAASPFPGWFYGVPLLAVTLLLLMAALLALVRVSRTSALPATVLAAADRDWRAGCTSVVTRLTTAALLGYAGGTTAFAGSAVRRAHLGLIANGHPAAASQVALGTGLALIGVVLVLLGCAVAGLAVQRAVAVRSLTLQSGATTPAPAR